MANGYVVLAPNTPPDPSKVLAQFVTGPLQGDATCQANAIAWKNGNFPTGTVQPMTEDKYNTDVVINP